MNRFLQIPAFITRATGACSIVGSSLIIYMIISDRKRKLSRPYHRIMLMMSAFDVIQSSSMVFSIAAFPHQSGIYGAKGNQLTCTIQGFLLVLGLAVPLYNSCLSIYYLLTIRYNISSEQFTEYEYILHAISILFPLSMAIMLMLHDSITPRSVVCYPRGKVSLLVTLLTFSTSFLVCIGSMLCISWTVISQATKTRKYTSFNTRRNSAMSRTDDNKNKTVIQAFLYALAFFLTYTFPFVGGMYTRGMDGVDPPHAVILLTSIFYPLQGFWNFVFYIRPGVQRVIKSNPLRSRLGAIGDVLSMRNGVDMINIKFDERRSLPHSSFPNGKVNSVAEEGDNSGLPTNSRDTSNYMYPVTESFGVTKMETDDEHQSNVRYKPESLRRLSLPDIASILEGQDLIDIDTEAELFNMSTTDDSL